jgi:hypothetical protein
MKICKNGFPFLWDHKLSEALVLTNLILQYVRNFPVKMISPIVAPIRFSGVMILYKCIT